MARCRNLKPGFFHNEALAELPPLTRILFQGLWCYADRDGRLEDRPKRLKSQILPYDDCDCDAALELLAKGDDPFIVRYSIDGQRFIQICKFAANQTPHYTEKQSVIPAPPEDSWIPPRQQQPAIKVRGSEVQRRVRAEDVPIPEAFNKAPLLAALSEWLEYKAKRGEAYRDPAYMARKVAEFESPEVFISAVHSSIGNNYAGLFVPKLQGVKQQERTKPEDTYREVEPDEFRRLHDEKRFKVKPRKHADGYWYGQLYDGGKVKTKA